MNATSSSCTATMPYGYQPSLKGVYIAMEIIIALLAVVGNFLVCLAVTRNKKLRTVTNYFLVSLAVADILVGLVAVPCAVLTDLGRPRYNLPLCLILLSILMALTQNSILSLLAVAAERYVAILMPFHYQRVMSPRNARLALLLTWMLGTITGTVPLMDWQRQPADSHYCIFTCMVDMSYMVYFNFFFCILVPLVVMFIIYSQIFITVRRQLRRIAIARGTTKKKQAAVNGSAGTTEAVTATEDAAGQGSAAEGTRGTETQTVTARGRGNEKDTKGNEGKCKADQCVGEQTESGIGSIVYTESTVVYTKPGCRIGSKPGPARTRPVTPNAVKPCVRIHRELRKATSLFLVLFLFMVCLFPIHCINCVLLLCPQCEVPMSLTLGAILLSHANSAINPLLYAYRMRSFRHTLAGMCRCRIRPKRQQEH